MNDPKFHEHLTRKTEMENKTLEDVINNPNFGNLAKLTVLTIITVGFVVAGIVIVIRDGDINAYVEAAKVLCSFIMAAVSGGVVTTFGKSETAKMLIMQNELNRSNDSRDNRYDGELQNESDVEVVETTSSGVHHDAQSLPVSYRVTEEAYNSGLTWDQLASRYGLDAEFLQTQNPGVQLIPGSVVKIS